MQTFLPYTDFAQSAKCLDRARLGKQRVECKQILQALCGASSAWENHPAVKMWRGYEIALCRYAISMCNEWILRGYEDNLRVEFAATFLWVRPISHDCAPPWLSDDRLHASHRSNLLRKMPEHYGKFGWAEPNDLPYFWPV